MTTLNEILGICIYKIRQKENDNHFMACYNCDGTRNDALRLQCQFYSCYDRPKANLSDSPRRPYQRFG